MNTVRAAAPLLATCMLLTACTTVEVNRFERVPSERVEHAFMRADADFSGFVAVMPGQVSVWTPTREAGLAPAAMTRLQTLYEEALQTALSSDGAYTLVTTRAPGVLELHTQFVNLRGTADPAAVRALQQRYSFPLEAGRATLVVELVDATSGRVLAHIADVEDRAEYAALLAGEDAEEVARRALARWAGVLRAFLDES